MRRSPLRTQAFALCILVVASVVGNVAVSAAGARPDATQGSPAVTPTDPSAADAARAPSSSEAAQQASATSTVQDGDDGHIVPAIYSWDPDITFVFYRHVAKWM